MIASVGVDYHVTQEAGGTKWHDPEDGFHRRAPNYRALLARSEAL